MLARLLLLSAFVTAPLLAADATSPLASAPSEFVRAQATSGVRWHPWTPATLQRAQASGKSVYVFIGSPLSELTRATINQTFSSEKTVAWINESFFCIFVDADAQPEVAALGQHFISSVKQLRGWPVHLWLTPDTLQPYDGANYLPPSEEWGKPGFLKAARSAHDTWKVDPARARALAAEAGEMMRLPRLDLEAKIDIEAKLAAAAKSWTAAADPVNGGFGDAPKLPEPELIRFLLTRDEAARAVAIKAARAVVNGALRDPVDGGFYRRCVDEAWKEPYFQKTLADQARIAMALFEAADAAKDEKLRAAGIGALDFVLTELKKPDGTFAAALDGTLEENPDRAKRPAFVKVGSASMWAHALFLSTLLRSGDERLVGVARELVQRYPRVQFRSASAADQLADDALMRQLASDRPRGLMTIGSTFRFDSETGSYFAVIDETPKFVRVPTLSEIPSAEVLALLAGVDARTADRIRRNLMNQIEYDELPPGDVLLGLSQK